MQFTNIFACVVLLASGAIATPTPPKPSHEKPSKPGPVTTTSQSNSCGNGATPYCCNTDNFGLYTTCKSLGGSSTCSATTVCCNANNSIQVCLGNAVIG